VNEEEIWFIKEYEGLRYELSERIKFLHNTINLAIVFWALFIILYFVFVAIGLSKYHIITYLLLIPIVLDMVGYNYQSNQNSLESIAKYFHEHIKPGIKSKYKARLLEWEAYFAKQKEPFKVESVTKVFSFIMPTFIPIYLLASNVQLDKPQQILAIFDLILFVLMLENFRYKLRRVK